MTRKRILVIVAALALLAAALGTGLAIAQQGGKQDAPVSGARLAPLQVMGHEITYQGRLLDALGPVDGFVDLTFRIYGVPVGNVPLWEETHTSVDVAEGQFSVLLGSINQQIPIDFNLFESPERYLAVEVGTDGEMSPRQPITTVPYAINSDTALTAGNASFAFAVPWSGIVSIPAGFADDTDDDILGGLSCTTDQITVFNGLAWACGDDQLGGGGGDPWSLTGNAGTSPGANFLGTTDDVALELHVNGLRAWRLEPNTTSPNVIGGYDGNNVTAGVLGATISGGGTLNAVNTVTDEFGTVGGGQRNQAGDNAGITSDRSHATVAGGINNTASGIDSTIGGGLNNEASANRSTIGGGQFNRATGDISTVGGGGSNKAEGSNSVVGGGGVNIASGDYSTVSGGRENEAVAKYATVSGGGRADPVDATSANHAYDEYGTIGGGGGNVAGVDDANTTNQTYATVGGGKNNVASGDYSTVSGGQDNQAAAEYATVSCGGRAFANDAGSANRVYDNFGSIGGGGENRVGMDDADTTNQPGATVGGGLLNDATGSSSTVSGGIDNTASGTESTVGGGISNTASGAKSTVGGGGGSTASDIYTTVSGGKNNIANGTGATVGGGVTNTASADYATVSGGGSTIPSDLTTANFAYDEHGTIGGGGGNVVGVDDADATNQTYATIGGGKNNTASGAYATVGGGLAHLASSLVSTIGGGDSNTASGIGSTIGGDFTNTANKTSATVSGGSGNTASGAYSTVPGGSSNIAGGDYSFAAGRNAQSFGDGTFVWADSTDQLFSTSAPNIFQVRASSGTRFYTDSDATVGVQLFGGSNSWNVISDRAFKENYALVDARSILEKLAEMPVGQWNLVTQDPSIQHIGPTAQDFRAAFGIGESDTHINMAEAYGVTMGATQGLYQMMQEKDVRIATLEEAAGTGSVTSDNGSPEFVWFITWALMGGIVLAGLFVGLRLRKVSKV